MVNIIFCVVKTLGRTPFSMFFMLHSIFGYRLIKLSFFVTKQKSLQPSGIIAALRDLVPFVQLKKREKHPWRSATFSKNQQLY